MELAKASWKFKLPLVAALSHAFLSLPFITGMLLPSMHEGNLYSTIYVIVHLPFIALLGGLASALALHFGMTSMYQENMVLILIAWVAIVILALIAGTIIDVLVTKRKETKTMEETG